MNPSTWARVKPLLAEAGEQPPAARERFLAERCADPALRREILALLASPAPLTAIVGAASLPPGSALGRYVIEQLVGRGGMGEVYRARDSKLQRVVAIKVLPAFLAVDRDRLDRFAREAKVLATLNHPHICTLHDVDTEDGVDFLVMEYVEGETLAQRLQKGPLPLEQALAIAIEIAEALANAHRRDVIHRDLKPGNIMLTKAGAKLLDFGLAKLTGHGEHAAAAEIVSAPTQSAPLTGDGVIVGTLQYMAPEQLGGKPADARTDLWALGAIVYEMLTGTPAFESGSAATLIAAILEREPAPLSARQPLTPLALERLVRRCLAKAPDDRPDTAHDLAADLRAMRETSGVAALAGDRPAHTRWPAVGLIAAWVWAGVFASAVVTSWLWSRWRPPLSQVPVVRAEVAVLPAEEVNAGGISSFWIPTPGGSRTALTWTPDGRALVFVGRRGGVQQLYLRRLDAAEASVVPNTEGAQVPAVSADGQWVAFWTERSIKKVALSGGPAMELVSGIAPPWGLVWDAGGRLFFGRGDGRIWQIPSTGVPAAVTTLGDREVSHSLPWPLPGARALLYTVRRRDWTWGDEEIVAHTLATGTRKPLLKDAVDARYLPTGHLVFLRRGQLFAVPFDAELLETRGTPWPVLDTVAQALTASNNNNNTGAGQFAIATSGSLAWIPGVVTPYRVSTLVAVDRRGQVSPLPAPPRAYVPNLRVSPDNRRLAVTIQTPSQIGLFALDLDRGSLTPLAEGGESSMAIWSHDGQRLVFSWLKDGGSSLAWLRPDGSSPPEILMVTDFVPSSWTSDGHQVVGTKGNDLAIATIENGKAHVQPLFQTPHNEQYPEVSPDGRWLAYGSNVSGRMEVYVQPYPGPGARTPVSVDGGTDPAWHPNGRELFYLSPRPKQRMMVASFEPSSPPRLGPPRPLFEVADGLAFACIPRCYDVAHDGQRFYVTQWRTLSPTLAVTHISLVLNWLEELKAKVPGR